MSKVRKINTCRSCGSDRLTPILSLGNHCVSDFMSQPDERCVSAPLNLIQCDLCTLVQLTHTVSRDLLYRTYWYRSGTNPSMVKALDDVVDGVLKRLKRHDGVWVDIGSNDSTLLNHVPEYFTRVGYEPSKNIIPSNPKLLIVNDYFSAKNFNLVRARVVSACAMLYDLDEPNQFLKDVKEILADDGIFVAQLNYLPAILENNDYGDICHEHLEYYSLRSLTELFVRNGLDIFDVEFNTVNGGSIRVYASHRGICQKTPAVYQAENMERETLTRRRLEDFKERVESNRRKTVQFLYTAYKEKKSVYGYGASTRGNTVLQYLNQAAPIDKLITAIADRNPDKWWKYVVGCNIPIIPEEKMREAKPDYLFILPYHFLDNFREREAELLKQGTKLVVPFPELKVIKN